MVRQMTTGAGNFFNPQKIIRQNLNSVFCGLPTPDHDVILYRECFGEGIRGRLPIKILRVLLLRHENETGRDVLFVQVKKVTGKRRFYIGIPVKVKTAGSEAYLKKQVYRSDLVRRKKLKFKIEDLKGELSGKAMNLQSKI